LHVGPRGWSRDTDEYGGWYGGVREKVTSAHRGGFARGRSVAGSEGRTGTGGRARAQEENADLWGAMSVRWVEVKCCSKGGVPGAVRGGALGHTDLSSKRGAVCFVGVGGWAGMSGAF